MYKHNETRDTVKKLRVSFSDTIFRTSHLYSVNNKLELERCQSEGSIIASKERDTV